jgi:hypothetical protein
MFGLLGFVLASGYFIATSGTGGEFYPPLSTMSPRPNGAMAFYELLDASGLTVGRHLSHVYDYPAGSAVALLDHSMPDAASMLFGGLDVKALTVWMKRGGSLLIAAGSYSHDLERLLGEIEDQLESPLHGQDYRHAQTLFQHDLAQHGYATVTAEYLGQGSGDTASSQSIGASRTAQRGEVYRIENSALLMLTDVEKIEIASPEYHPRTPGLTLLQAGDPPQPVVIWLPVGEGELFWLSTPEIATNGWIQRGDNHRLMLNLAKAVARDRTMYFDEFRHGYRESQLDTVGLLLHSAGGRLLMLAILLCVVGFAGSAIAPARYQSQPLPPRRQSAEMILAQASLYQRAGVRRPVATHLLDGLRQAVRRYERWGNPPDDSRLREWLHNAAASGMPVESMLLKFVDGKLSINSEQQLMHLARACDQLRKAL